MLKKFRCIYWKQRDRGKGRQCLFLFGLLAIIFLAFFLNLIRLGIQNEGEPAAGVTGGAVSGSVTSGSTVSAEAVSGETMEELNDTEELKADQSDKEESRYEFDTTGISSLLSFMTDEAFEKLVADLKKECEKRQATSIRTLDYQKISNTYQVTAYLIASDNCVFKLSYNLKNSAVSVSRTELSQNDVISMKKADEKKSAEKLKRERQEKKKKLEKAKKKLKKKTKKEVG